MLKFTFSNNNKRTIGIGLSQENVNRLKKGLPIHVHFSELNLPDNYELFLFYGKTEEIMKKQLENHIGPDTVVRENMKPGKYN